MDKFESFLKESSEAALKKKAEKSGFSLSILRQVYKRGVAAWKTGHRPGTTPQQWGMARVNSFITGGKTRVKGDPDLWKKQKAMLKNKKEQYMNEASEDDMPATPDEASMAMKQAEFLEYVGREVGEHVKSGKPFPEWMQNKLSALHQKAKDMHATLGDHGEDDEEEMKEMKSKVSLDKIRRIIKR